MGAATARSGTRRDLRSRRRLRSRIVATGVVVAAAAGLSVAGTWAAWTVTSTNPGNQFSTSTVLLQDNQGGQGGATTSTGSALFTVTDMSPGASYTRCIGVDFSGASASAMTLSAALSGTDAALLDDVLTVDAATYNTSGTVTVTPGVDTNGGSCADHPGGGTDTAIGTQGATLATWAAAGPYSIASPVTDTWYEFTVAMDPAATSCATYCGKTLTLALTWTLTTA